MLCGTCTVCDVQYDVCVSTFRVIMCSKYVLYVVVTIKMILFSLYVSQVMNAIVVL